jgi:hypothetical protein
VSATEWDELKEEGKGEKETNWEVVLELTLPANLAPPRSASSEHRRTRPDALGRTYANGRPRSITREKTAGICRFGREERASGLAVRGGRCRGTCGCCGEEDASKEMA